MNPRPPESQSGALPTELRPPSQDFKTVSSPSLPILKRKVARPAGFEPATHGLEGRCSIQLSYGRIQSNQLIQLYSKAGKWSGMRDLNPRHPAPKAGALPDCANPRMSHQAVSNEMAHNTDQAGFRQSEIENKCNFI